MSTQTEIISDLLDKLEKKCLNSESICQAILENDVHKQNEVEFIDALCQTVVTSLNFNDYRRAAKYLALTVAFCDQRR